MIRPSPLFLICIASSLLLSACSSGRQKATDQEVAPSSYGTDIAMMNKMTETAIKEGKVDTWIAAPVYHGETAMLSIYRGPKPNTDLNSQPGFGSSLRSGSSSDISWKRGFEYQDALLNVMRVLDQSDELIFPETPHAFAEFVFLTPRVDSPAPAAPPVKPSTILKTEAGDHVVHIVLETPHAEPAPEPQATGPQLIVPQGTPHHVANFFNAWALPKLKHDLALGCAVLRTERKNDKGEKTWSYRGEIWVRNLHTGEVFKHTDTTLEPTAWQLHPGDRPQLEVTMADAEGWPSRVDFIDLNTFEVRSMPSRTKLKEMGLK